MTWHVPECPLPSPVHPALAFFLPMSRGVRLQAQKGEAGSVAVILALDERPGEAKGAFLATLTGVPKPGVSGFRSLGSADAGASAGSQNMNSVWV